ncbi:MAG: 5'-methylthioadenosine/S-adenosylhomocysteine nucleosidase [Lachnospiraceae bacterium]|nr:5'-methylthioadenosine/S-adenosylhomocysteine nucleosidase [Lachnospiraceae bacterium]
MTREKTKIFAIVGAMEQEVEYVSEYLKSLSGWMTFDREEKDKEQVFIHYGQRIQLVTKVLGVGKVNAAFRTADLIHDYSPDLIINVGYAGGLADRAVKGDVAIGTTYVQADFLPLLEANRPVIAGSPQDVVSTVEHIARSENIRTQTGTIATGDFFLNDSGKKAQIKTEFGAVAFDMESAAIAQVATEKNVAFISIRTISDFADEHALEHFKEPEGARIPIEQRPVALAVLTAQALA